MQRKKILLVGFGKMGGSLLNGIIKAGVLARNIMVIEPNPDALDHKFNVRILKGFDQEDVSHFAPDVIILAVKPQVVESILADYKQFAGRSLFISVIAGKTISYFEKHIGKNASIIRTMPNLPVAVNEGVIVASKNHNVSLEQEDIINQIFQNLGTLYGNFVDEKLLDAVTAISGSGPAYVFYFMECLIESAIKLGLDADMAKNLVYYTIRGSAGLAIKSPKSASKLREMVTSPAGTTEAALKVLMGGNKMKELIIDASTAACARSKELSE